MKKHVLSAMFAVLSLSLLTSCDWKKQAEKWGLMGVHEQDSIDVEVPAGGGAYEIVDWSDSVHIAGDAYVKVSLKSVKPRWEEQVLNDSIALWICRELDDEAGGYRHDISGLLSFRGSGEMKDDVAELKSFAEDAEDASAPYEFDEAIEVAYENDEYVTLQHNLYVYKAGAHGSFISTYATFRKTDGHIMDWELVKDMSEKEIKEAIKRGLMEHFSVNTEQALYENLFEPQITLPATPPFLLKDGVTVIYQQYEIASYADGMPSFVIKK